jgi:hypothetical protein
MDDLRLKKYVWSDSGVQRPWGVLDYRVFIDAMKGARFVRSGNKDLVWHTLVVAYRTDKHRTGSSVCLMSFDLTSDVMETGRAGLIHERRLVYVNGDVYSVEKSISGIFFDGLQEVGYMSPTIYE